MKTLIAILLAIVSLSALGATATYKPNSANCTAYEGGFSGDPTGFGLTGDIRDAELDSTGKNTISTDDGNAFYSTIYGYCPTDSNVPFVRGCFKIVEDEGTITQLKLTVKNASWFTYFEDPCETPAGLDWTYELYAWDDELDLWTNKAVVVVESDPPASAGTLTISSSCGNYVDSSGMAYFIVSQPARCGECTGLAGEGSGTTLYYMELEVTYSTAHTLILAVPAGGN